PGVGPAPAPPGLLLVGGVPVGAEDAGLLLGAQADVRVVLAHGRPLDHLVDGAGRPLEPADPLLEQGPLALQVLARIGGGIVEDRSDLRERQTEFAVDEHPVDAGHVLRVVEAVPRPGAPARAHQADRIPVVQGAHAHADEVGDASHGEVLVHCRRGHGRHRPACRRVRVKGARSHTSARAAGRRRTAVGAPPSDPPAPEPAAPGPRSPRWSYAGGMTLPLLVDCDTGIDDAIALTYLAAHPDAEIAGVV